ncbi:MAG: tripartite tricarboxylate transporter substrate binding protein [Pseudomonadota bacterium]
MTRVLQHLARAVVATALLATGAASAQQAQPWPQRPVTIVVGFAAGSTADLVARAMATSLSQRTGGSFVVDNKTGANGMLAASTVARAKPDGTTLLISTSSPLTVNPHLYPNPGYVPQKDFRFITPIVSVPLVVTVNPNQPLMKNVFTIDDLKRVGAAKANGLTYGSAGNGNLTHLAAAQLSTSLGFKSVHVPFRGSAPADIALLAGDVDYTVGPISNAQLIKDGKLRALMVTDSERWADLPAVPSVTDMKMPEMGIVAWTALLAPAGTPDDIIEALGNHVRAITVDPRSKQSLGMQGRIWTLTPAQFSARVADESTRYGDLVKQLNIKLE